MSQALAPNSADHTVDTRTLPVHPNLEHLKNQAKALLEHLRQSQPDAGLSDAQYQLACDYGFSSWRALKEEVDLRCGHHAPIPGPEEVARRRAEQAMPRQAVPFAPEEFDKFAGFYQLRGGHVFTITREDSRFFSQLTGQVSVELFPESDTKFFARAVDAQISFLIGPQGQAASMTLHQVGMEQQAFRVDAATAQAVNAALAERIQRNIPSPGTRTYLLRHIDALQKGEPDYATMTPALAALARQQMPSIAQLLQRWGVLKSVDFRAVSRQGWDIYDVAFQHVATEWRITPLEPDGRVGGLGVRELP